MEGHVPEIFEKCRIAGDDQVGFTEGADESMQIVMRI